MLEGQKLCVIFEYFRIFHTTFRIFSNVFECFRIFSNVFERFWALFSYLFYPNPTTWQTDLRFYPKNQCCPRKI